MTQTESVHSGRLAKRVYTFLVSNIHNYKLSKRALATNNYNGLHNLMGDDKKRLNNSTVR